MTVPPETDRLILRDWTQGDFEPFHAICSDPDVMRFVGDGQSWSTDRTQQWLERASEMSKAIGYCLWALSLKDSLRLIGYCGFIPASDGAEIGWRLAKDAWGRGLATEAARRVLNYGFDTLGFNHVIATVQAANRGSIRVCEKLGMKVENSFQRNGREVLVFGKSKIQSVNVE